MSGLFGTLHVGKSGIFANQKAIDVTSHNMANANTEGYSRQRAELQTERPFCTPSMNNAVGAGQLGRGVNVADINRIRDAFLDYQVRIELGVQGTYVERNKFLNEIENIFSEPSETGISTLLGKFHSAWQELSKQPHSSNARTVVAEQSKALTDELNHLHKQLNKLKDNTKNCIRQDLNDVNSILDQMERLNEEIIQITAAGQKPNDLLDRRDLLIDKLSSKFGINIDKKGLNAIDINTNGQKGAEPPTGKNLIQAVNPEEAVRLAYISSIEPDGKHKPGEAGKYKITYYKNADVTDDKNKVTFEITLDENQYKELDRSRTLWTDKKGDTLDKDGNVNKTPQFDDLKIFNPNTGTLNGYMTVQDDIDVQIEQLDKLARSLAYAVNFVHEQGDKNNVFFVNKNDDGTYGDEDEITAGNIAINKAILDDVMKIKVGKEQATIGETDGNRALAIANLMDKLIAIQNIQLKTENGKIKTSRTEFITNICGGEIEDDGKIKTIKGNTNGMPYGGYFKDVVDKLGVQSQEAKRMVKNQFIVLSNFQQSREQASGVSIDEETTNLIQFQHAYQANAKIISTVDELLDVVINGLKR
ncbi:flagellar hook-associated protein FlgK [Clostridium tetani]|uniref:flagellar hook-associated protein FlgK n=1 Tax=Clostridium tetani TaxID=1513 RepID=UPI000513C413|nr:flagellar hook-associated protein FlgK [Clostridium tetani]KGI44248.1 flagellar hook protein FlgK [Clostridium tetani]RXI52115.1 flagellar hook-associated protein FlgK [Clostridium tetani]RXI53885.1 flagellar hook-associated protein FlgK [Clostridium tetani]RXM69145.1 flagellar hook-associated protein FlgK [Clostridium tetani]RXM78539.1 flagellar hook-associated protein FlgK [Clostridium tetani]